MKVFSLPWLSPQDLPDSHYLPHYVNFLSLFTSFRHSSGHFWCLLSWVDWENVLWHLSHLNGFSPVWVRMWLFRVVAPAKERPQKPHLNGFSLMWITTCSLSSAGPGNEEGQCPHWYGRSGDCNQEQNAQLIQNRTVLFPQVAPFFWELWKIRLCGVNGGYNWTTRARLSVS